MDDSWKIVTRWTTRTNGGIFLTVEIPAEVLRSPLGRLELFKALEMEAGARAAGLVK